MNVSFHLSFIYYNGLPGIHVVQFAIFLQAEQTLLEGSTLQS